MTYAQPLIYGLTAWYRAWESAAMTTIAGLAARACTDRWAWI